MAAGGSHHHWSVMLTQKQENDAMVVKQDKNKTLIEQTKATRFQPNVSGNPAGRPPNKDSITYQIKQALAKSEGIEAKALAEMAIKEAKKGSYPHFKEILDRTDGKVAGDIPTQDNRSITFIIGDSSLIDGIGKRLNDAIRGDEEIE